MWSNFLIKERKFYKSRTVEVAFVETHTHIWKMPQLDRENFQQLEGFYRIIGNRSKYWEIRGNIVKQYDAHDLFPESNKMSIEYGDLGKEQTSASLTIKMMIYVCK